MNLNEKNAKNAKILHNILEKNPTNPLISESFGFIDPYKNYHAEIEIEETEILIDILIVDNIAMIKFYSLDRYYLKNYDELVNFREPIKAFSKIISSIKDMLEVVNKYEDVKIGFESEDYKRVKLYKRLAKKLGCTIKTNSDKFIII